LGFNLRVNGDWQKLFLLRILKGPGSSDDRSLSHAGFNREDATRELGSLPHAGQAQAPLAALPRRERIRCKSNAVVFDGELDLALSFEQGHIGELRPAVFGHVVQGLLEHSKDRDLELLGDLPLLHIGFHLEAVAGVELPKVPAKPVDGRQDAVPVLPAIEESVTESTALGDRSLTSARK